MPTNAVFPLNMAPQIVNDNKDAAGIFRDAPGRTFDFPLDQLTVVDAIQHQQTGVIKMRTMTLCAVAAALAIGTTLAGVGFVQSRQLGTGDDVLGRGGAVAGREGTVSDTATAEDQRAVAPAALGECVTNRTAFRTQTNLVATTSTAFVLMPNTHFPVTTSGGCLIVDFSAELTTIVDTSIQIRASIAGIGEAQPPSAFMERNYDGTLPWRVHSMRFVFPNVPAGQHVVRIEFRSTENEVYAATRTLTVQYRP